jgi:hypothetical protein
MNNLKKIHKKRLKELNKLLHQKREVAKMARDIAMVGLKKQLDSDFAAYNGQ